MLSAYRPRPSHSELPPWAELRWSHVLGCPLPRLSSATDRALTRLVCLAALKQVALIEGWENILPRRDPFLLVANHSSRREALFLPAFLLLARGGQRVRFLADWNFRLIPGVGHLYDRSGAITLTRKPAKPRVLNLLKPCFEPEVPPLDEARSHLVRGGSVGIFPEGAVNRNADRLMRGRRAAARLSLETGVPVVPVGIRFDRRHRLTGQVDSSSAISICIGEAMTPESHEHEPIPPRAVTSWNRQLMTEIGRLCGKERDGVEHDDPGRLLGSGSNSPASPNNSE